jgi:hypothetical protein
VIRAGDCFGCRPHTVLAGVHRKQMPPYSTDCTRCCKVVARPRQAGIPWQASPSMSAVWEGFLTLRRAKAASSRTSTGSRPFLVSGPWLREDLPATGNLTRHNHIHTREKPCECTFSGYGESCSTGGNLQRHQSVLHSGAMMTRLECTLCDRTFSRPDNRAEHRRRLHGNRP